jgi:iron-sulfur cluster insertion protein
MTTKFSITPFAIEKIQARIRLDGRLDLKFRISIEGGGCSGLQYAYDLCQSPGVEDQDHDEWIVLWQDGITVVSDELSAQYLKDATLDYVQDLKAAKFVIHNPNTEMTCGCGSSFTLKDA